MLLTPDDPMKDGPARARQNVIFELGYFIGKLGRERVTVLKRGEVEVHSDYSGVIYHEIDNAEIWKQQLRQELVAAGVTLK